MAVLPLLLAAMGLLLVDSTLELALISNMVGWLHYYAGGQFQILNPAGGSFSLHGKPAGLLVDQGHTSNGAAGTALIPVCFAGFTALYLRSRQVQRNGNIHGFGSFLYYFFLTFTVLSFLLTFVALIYVMVVTYQHNGQKIDIAVAAALNNHPYPNYVAYPLLKWTPQNWFAAVLDLPLGDVNMRNDISFNLKLMYGWQWNLIPMTILNLAVMVLAFLDYRAFRRGSDKIVRGQEKLEYTDA